MVDGYNVVLYNEIERRSLVAAHYPSQILKRYDRLRSLQKLLLWRACFVYVKGGICITSMNEDLKAEAPGNEETKVYILHSLLSNEGVIQEPDHPTSAPLEQIWKTPTIVFTWTQKVDNRQGYWGLGDTLRGILTVYQFCKANRYEFAIDTHLHPFSHFLEEQTSPNHVRLEESGKGVRFEGDDGGGFASLHPTITSGGTHCIFCNAYPKEPLLSDEKRLIRDLLAIKKEFRLDLSGDYSVMHIRVGDAAINGVIGTTELQRFTKIVTAQLAPGDILCSDSVQLKRHIASIADAGIRVFVNEGRSGHVGYDTDPALLRNTLDDLQILLGARRIFTYSTYSWVSGFVDWVAKCFDIPLIDVKKE